MKTLKTITSIFIAIICILIYVIGAYIIDEANIVSEAINVIIQTFWMVLMAVYFPVSISLSIERKANKEQEDRYELERIKGANMYLDQLSDTDRFKGITNKDLPIFNNKNEKIGTTTTYSDLRDFLDYKFKP